MDQWVEMGRRLRELVNPSTMPVAVKIAKEGSQIPSKAKRPLRDLGVRMAPCQGAGMARRYGWTVAFTHEDVGCAIAAHTYGWERLTEKGGAINFFIEMNYAADRDAATKMIECFPLLPSGDDPILIYTPLERTRIEPDVILIYVNAAQMMRLIHGATYHTGEPLQGRFSGRPASCTEGIIGAYLGKDARVVVPGNGDRVWASCQDHEVILALHASKMAELIEGLEQTHKKGIRYPIPMYLRYQPEVGFTLPLSDIFKPEEIKKFTK